MRAHRPLAFPDMLPFASYPTRYNREWGSYYDVLLEHSCNTEKTQKQLTKCSNTDGFFYLYYREM
jgi:hypothetical protein